MASAGFNATTDESNGPFSVPNNAPEVSILSPTDSDLFIGTQLIFFQGAAIDREDLRLTGANLEWRSDKDGLLGTGEILNLEATELSRGDHTITVTATDSSGLTATTSVNISINQCTGDRSAVL
jgi:hypothetical protein